MNINILSIDELDLTVRSTNCLHRAGVHTFGDMVDLYEKGGLCNVRNLGKKSEEEIIDKINEYCNKAKTDEQLDNEPVLSVCAENYDEWVRSESGKEFILSFLKEKNVEISCLGFLSARAYNILALGSKKYLHQIIFFERNELMKINRMDIFSAAEIAAGCREYLNENKEVFIAAFNKNNVESENSEITVFDILHDPEHREAVYAYVKANDIFIGDWNVENRPKNQLLKNGFSYLSDIIFMTTEEFRRLPAMGMASVENILEKINEYLRANSERMLAFCNGDISSAYTDNEISKRILDLYKNESFAGFSFKDFTEKLNLPEEIENNRIKSVIGKLIAADELEYVDYRCYRRYKKFKDYLKDFNGIDERNRELIFKRLNGETLENIGKEYGLTRERVRQVVKDKFEKIRNNYKSETGLTCFDEDYFERFYSTYAFEKADAKMWFGIGQDVFFYMEMRDVKQGKAELLYALEDARLDIGLKLKIKNYLNRNKLLLDGVWVEKKRNELEKYVLGKYCRDDVSFDEFVKIYNSFLESEKVPYDEKVYYTHDILRSRKNHLSDSRFVLWKQSEQIRFYDIDARDYTELLNVLNLDGYEKIELSTLKFMDDYPEIMQKYDIRDQYELHNLLRKIIPENSYHQFRCGRTPMISFDEFDRSAAMLELILNNAPIEYDAFLEIVRKEYGFESGAIPWNSFSEYYHQGVYRVDYKAMSSENKALLKEKLTEDFYYIDEIKKIYEKCIPDADITEINPYNLKLMGFVVLSRYAVHNYSSLDAYFTDILTKDDIVDLTPYRRRFTYVQAFSSNLHLLKKRQIVFEFDPNQIINIRKLEAAGVTKEDINAFCDRVYGFVDDNTFFSIASLRNKGFEDELYDLGFSDWFYANILASDERFSSGQVFSNVILYKGKSDVTIKNFEMWLVRSFGSIDVYDLMTELTDNYGCRIDEKSDVTYRLYGTEIYYDNILDRFYSSAEAYYRELEETDGM